jgi:hypothetical protein
VRLRPDDRLLEAARPLDRDRDAAAERDRDEALRSCAIPIPEATRRALEAKKPRPVP